MTEIERFMSKVDVSDGCWQWTGAVHPIGYGMFRSGREQYAHRVSYKLFVGPIPAGLTLDHKCRNRGCVNPHHLEPVTLAQNVRRSPRTKLTASAIDDIRSCAGSVSMVEMARKYGVTRQAIWRVVHNKSWNQ